MWSVRQATPNDEKHLRRLIDCSTRIVMRFRPEQLAEYLSRRPFLLAEQAVELRGFLACLMIHPPRAMVAAAGLADDWTLSDWLERLLPHCLEHLQTQGATSLSYVGAAFWLAEGLLTQGFQFVSNVMAYEKTDTLVPQEGNRSVQVRPVRSSDLADLVAIDILDFHPLWRNTEETLAHWRATLPFFVVALAEGDPAGYCTCSLKGTHGHLNRMAVHPARQGQGIGTRLVAEAMRFFEKTGARLITLNTQEENDRAQRLYGKFGFRLMGREAVALWRDLGN